MAYSPLLRTLARLTLDNRSVALVKYELSLEDVSVNLQLPPEKENFNDSRWADLRVAHESKRTRGEKQKSYEQDFVTIIRGRKLQDDRERRSKHYHNLVGAWEDIIPASRRALKEILTRTGFTEWKPPLLSDCLLFEQSSPTLFACGHVCVAETGVLDRRLLHHALSPKYVPKPHFKMERKRLEAKSAEFASFVAQQPNIIPRPQDESSDEGLLSINEAEDSTKGARLGKRKRAAAGGKKKRIRKPARFIKLYDCKAHDYPHLKSQAINQFSLVQQRLPRVESPAFEQVSATARNPKDEPPTLTADEDPVKEGFGVYGLMLPTVFPWLENEEGEEELPSIEEAAQYRVWRSHVKSYFEERDRYMQSRVYRERARDGELLRATQALTGFWARMNT